MSNAPGAGPSQPLGTPLPQDGSPVLWDTLDRVYGPGRVTSFITHAYEQGLEIFFAPDVPADWTPSRAQVEALCALGFLIVYHDFADDTEVVGGWREAPRGDRPGVWAMGPRQRVGAPRYAAGAAARAVVLRGAEVDEFRDFLAARRARASRG